MIFRKTFAEINLDALKKNFDFVSRSFEDRFICPMVKANGYGHGDLVVSKALETWGAQQLGVCLVEEGIRLRKGKIRCDVLVFRGFDRVAAEALFEYKLTPVLSQFQHVSDLVSASKRLNREIDCHIKFDTGMNRLGFEPQDVDQVILSLKKGRRISVKGVLTHLHTGEDADQGGGASLHQLKSLSFIRERFLEAGYKEIQFHVYNSAGAAHLFNAKDNPNHPLAKFERKLSFDRMKSPAFGLRPGLMIYGYCETLTAQSKKNTVQNIEPVMTLKSRIANIRTLKKNETVSYGGTWKATRKSSVGIVPIGYADGYHRRNSNRASVSILNHQVPVIGRVCMDYLMVDLTDFLQKTQMSLQQDSLFQSDVILFGPKSKQNQISAEEVAQTSDTISWEVLTSIGERVPRVYTGETSQRMVKAVTGP
ncbi:MAG: alanine racemase [Pseudobdellovibrionaceae bacterium]